MHRRDKVLLGITIAVAALDAGLAVSTYVKKRGIVIRDMVLKSIDDRIYRKDGGSGEKAEIPIE